MSHSISRRGLIGPGAAALALTPGLARATTLDSLLGGDHLPPPTKTPAKPATPPAENIQGAADAENRLTVETWLNGKGPFRFIVDTGADRSCIAQEVAASLGLVPNQSVVVQGIARAVPAQSVQIDSIRMGRSAVTDLPVPLLPRAWLGADGYLGLDVIDNKAVTFDFQNQRLTIQDSGGDARWVPVADQALVRVNGSNGRLTAVNSSVDGVHAYAFIDTGAEITIGNTRLFAELAKQGAKYMSDDVIQLLGVTGGAAEGRIAQVERIRVGSVAFVHSALVISDLSVFDVWGLAHKPALFIGMNFLRTTAQFTIDYGRKELRFKFADNLRLARA